VPPSGTIETKPGSGAGADVFAAAGAKE